MTSARNDADHSVEVTSHLQGTVVTWERPVGSSVRDGEVLGLIESMKLHHEVRAPADGEIIELLVEVGATLAPGTVIARIALGAVVSAAVPDSDAAPSATGLGRADLSEVVERHRIGTDEIGRAHV